MTRNHWLPLAAGLVAGLVVSGRYALVAQERGGTEQPKSSPSPRAEAPTAPKVFAEPTHLRDRQQARVESKEAGTGLTVQDAISRPYRFPFSRPTSLEQVCAHLRQTLGAPVVLDLAALDRQQVEPENTVQLELDGVRLKTGLKLLLDQVGLTFHIVGEDNLLIITDREGSADPTDRIWSELHALHGDLHDLQDSVDDLREILGDDKGEGPRVRKPTIIEEMPENVEGKPMVVPEKPGPPLEKPGGTPAVPPAGTRSGASRVPLSARRHPL